MYVNSTGNILMASGVGKKIVVFFFSKEENVSG